MVDGLVEITFKDVLVRGMCYKDGARAAEGAVNKFRHSRSVAAKRYRHGLEIVQCVIAHRCVAAVFFQYISMFLCCFTHPFRDHIIGQEGGSEVDTEFQFRAEDILRIIGYKFADVPCGRTECRVHRKIHLSEGIDKTHKFVDSAGAEFGVAGVAWFAFYGQTEGFGSFGGRNHLIVSRFPHNQPFPARTVAGVCFRAV